MVTQGSEVVTQNVYGGNKRGFVGFIYDDKSFRLYATKEEALRDSDSYKPNAPNCIGSGRTNAVCDVTPIEKPKPTLPYKNGDYVYIKNGHVSAGRRGDFFGYIGYLSPDGKCADIYGNPNGSGYVGMADTSSEILIFSSQPTEMVWFDRNGKGWLPVEMKDDHLQNCLEFCRIRIDSVRRNNPEPSKAEAVRQQLAKVEGWRELFKAEIARRAALKPKEKLYNVWCNPKVNKGRADWNKGWAIAEAGAAVNYEKACDRYSTLVRLGFDVTIDEIK